MLKYIFIALLSLFPAISNANEVLASIGGVENITKDDLRKYVEKRVDMAGTFKNSYAVENSLNEMIFTRLLVLEGVEKSIPRAETKAMDDRYDNQYGFSVFRTLSVPCLPLKDKAEEKKYFDEHPEVFRVNTTVRLFRYMLPKKQANEPFDATEKMMEWAKGWSSEKMTLDQIGAEASKFYNIEIQGDIGWIQLSNDVQIMRGIDSAKTGELVGPVAEGGFVYLFYVAGKHEARQLQWGEVNNQVSEMAVSFCARRNSENIKNNLYSKYRVNINKENIKKIFSDN